jgi:hypothetical protein
VKTITITLALASIFTISGHGQGFQNLNFESAQNLPGNPPIPNGVDVATTNALPDWAANAGPNPLSNIYYVSNFISGVSSMVELEGGSLALSGDFSVGLYGGGSIGQTDWFPRTPSLCNLKPI